MRDLRTLEALRSERVQLLHGGERGAEDSEVQAMWANSRDARRRVLCRVPSSQRIEGLDMSEVQHFKHGYSLQRVQEAEAHLANSSR